MTSTSGRAVRWSARGFGIALCLFLGLFALDAFGEGRPRGEAIQAFVFHLVPAGVVLVIVLAAWRRMWFGGVGLAALAVLYATTMARGRPDWMLGISGPLLAGAALYWWSEKVAGTK